MHIRKKKKRSVILSGGLILILAVVISQAVTLFLPEEERRLRQLLYDEVRALFPESDRKIRAAFGLFAFGDLSGESQRRRSLDGRPPVVLIHGLDEPGRVWLNLAPALHRAGWQVWLFKYPDDQAVERSATFFLEALRSARFDPKIPISIVAHSMGGLVARQMLTDPGAGFADAVKRGEIPTVLRLIMVGTPNHGAELARMRIVMEVREQVLNLIRGDAPWYLGLFDGLGAAGLDLLPESRFLHRLNTRPLPKGVSMTVIAGVLCPLLPVGDGLVSETSARLATVPLIRVKGSHLTMIRNWFQKSARVPPAVPVIETLLSK